MSSLQELSDKVCAFIFRCLYLKDAASDELIIKFERELTDCWYLTNDPIDRKNLIELNIFDSAYSNLRALTSIPQLVNMKRLKIASEIPADLHVDGFCRLLSESFESLEQLEIECWPHKCQPIHHPNVKRLYVEFSVEAEESTVQIDCPRLVALGLCNHSGPINLCNPEKLVHFCCKFRNFHAAQFDLKPFKSLAYLNLDDLFYGPSIDLNDHPQLQVIRFDSMDVASYEYCFVRERLVILLEQKERLKRSSLEVYSGNTLITDVF